jgi:hypothetical protein
VGHRLHDVRVDADLAAAEHLAAQLEQHSPESVLPAGFLAIHDDALPRVRRCPALNEP